VTAYYPGVVRTFTNRVDFTDTILAEHVNSLQDEVNAIESNLGTYIRTSSGWIGSFDQTTTTWNTLKDRIANIEFGLNSVFTAVPAGGSAGQVLTKNSSSDYDAAWTTFSALPSQTGQAGTYLTTDGTTASWAAAETTISPILLIGA
jgi:hypothetical protein